MKYITGVIVVALLLIGGWYLISNDQAPQSGPAENRGSDPEKLAVATSFYPLQFALEEILGDMGVVTNIGAGIDPHDFEPTTQDILALQQADLVVLQGADFEPWGDDVMDRLIDDGVPVVLATADIELHEAGHHHDEDMHEEEGHEVEYEDEHEDEHGDYDPHTWLDPVLFSEMVENIMAEIVAIDPANATKYAANAGVLKAELAALDTEFKTELANCELDEVITSHDAFAYLAERYEFEVHPISGLSTQDMPSITTMAELKEEAEEGIGAILLEENSVAAYGETLARETGLETLSINPVAYIVPTGENYITLMQSNLDSFATALKCDE
jgi:zinc transport system substrate-binding protein